MIKKLVQTENEVTPLVLRVMLGIVIFPHGMQKLLGWFGGHGFEGTMGFFTGNLGIPAVFAFLAIIAEAFGSLGLITGLLTRAAAFGVTITIAVAGFMLSAQNGFFMNWFGSQKGEGYEYHLLFVAIGTALMITGGGKWSADRLLFDTSDIR
jgi:putative oxidoreductase